MRRHAQEMEESVTSAHIETFVTVQLDLGQAGRAAIETLVSRAAFLLGRELPRKASFWTEGGWPLERRAVQRFIPQQPQYRCCPQQASDAAHFLRKGAFRR